MASRKTVLCHGVFDVFHYGHLLHLEAARKLGNRLVVAVTRDEFVNKGPGRPAFGQKKRARIVRALRCVDRVILVRDSIDAMRRAKPAVFVKGREYDGALKPEDAAYAKKHGIRVAFTDCEVHSSTKLLPFLAVPDRLDA